MDLTVAASSNDSCMVCMRPGYFIVINRYSRSTLLTLLTPTASPHRMMRAEFGEDHDDGEVGLKALVHCFTKFQKLGPIDSHLLELLLSEKLEILRTMLEKKDRRFRRKAPKHSFSLDLLQATPEWARP